MVRYGAATGEMLLLPAPDGATVARFSAAGIAIRSDILHEALQGMAFAIRPSSFFQTNTLQAEVMAHLVLSHVPTGPNITVVDAYCGVGTFAALIARRAGRVLAIEESASAVSDARDELGAIGIRQCYSITRKDGTVVAGIARSARGGLADPPRTGCQAVVIAALNASRVPRIIYISCDPATLARDLRGLCGSDGAYHLAHATPLDMFPQTHHIETVTVLDANTSSE